MSEVHTSKTSARKSEKPVAIGIQEIKTENSSGLLNFGLFIARNCMITEMEEVSSRATADPVSRSIFFSVGLTCSKMYF